MVEFLAGVLFYFYFFFGILVDGDTYTNSKYYSTKSRRHSRIPRASCMRNVPLGSLSHTSDPAELRISISPQHPSLEEKQVPYTSRESGRRSTLFGSSQQEPLLSRSIVTVGSLRVMSVQADRSSAVNGGLLQITIFFRSQNGGPHGDRSSRPFVPETGQRPVSRFNFTFHFTFNTQITAASRSRKDGSGPPSLVSRLSSTGASLPTTT